MTECLDRMKKGYDSHTFEEYTAMEAELTVAINSLIQETANKYCIIPVIELVEPNVVSVYIINKYGKFVETKDN